MAIDYLLLWLTNKHKLQLSEVVECLESTNQPTKRMTFYPEIQLNRNLKVQQTTIKTNGDGTT